MRILLSAYACAPDTGSEPGVGWRWAVAMNRSGHRLVVVTRGEVEAAVEAARAADPEVRRIEFVYIGTPRGHRLAHRIKPLFPLYYMLWQWRAARRMERIHRRDPFDVVHHLTYGGVRLPSFMGRLGARFILGPLGGGEQMPPNLLRTLPWPAYVKEMARILSNRWVRVDPLLRRMFRQADEILVKTDETARLVPDDCRHKLRQHFEIGVTMPDGEPAAASDVPRPLPRPLRRPLRLLFVGRFLYWKGGDLALRAFAALLRDRPHAELTFVGQGPEGDRWRRLAEALGVADKVRWVPWMAQPQLHATWRSQDVFLFPSLHDSSGNVVLEALAHGLPVVCLALGGPGRMVGVGCGFAVEAAEGTPDHVAGRLANALARLYDDPDLRHALSEGARARAALQSWSAQVAGVYDT
ncbi:MAG TPA: glycosyltransferase family 4 protein [Arenibaculum sp.]|nr:glycosyltransferase family 4 protein [Arenibaculum sp.]